MLQGRKQLRVNVAAMLDQARASLPIHFEHTHVKQDATTLVLVCLITLFPMTLQENSSNEFSQTLSDMLAHLKYRMRKHLNAAQNQANLHKEKVLVYYGGFDETGAVIGLWVTSSILTEMSVNMKLIKMTLLGLYFQSKMISNPSVFFSSGLILLVNLKQHNRITNENILYV